MSFTVDGESQMMRLSWYDTNGPFHCPIPRHPPARPGDPYQHRAARDPPAGPGDDGGKGMGHSKGLSV